MYLPGYAVKRGGMLFQYTDGHYTHYEPRYGIFPGTMHHNASEAMRALKYSNGDNGPGGEIVRVRIEFEPVDMKDIENEFNKDRIKVLKEKISPEDIAFIKRHM